MAANIHTQLTTTRHQVALTNQNGYGCLDETKKCKKKIKEEGSLVQYKMVNLCAQE